MLKLAALIAGILIGLIATRRWRPLLLERWRFLVLLPLLLLSSLLPWLFSVFRPQWLWTEDRSLLISLQAFSYLLALLIILVNIWPRSGIRIGQPDFHWFHRAPLVIVGVGVLAEAAVVLLNHGMMPIPENYLDTVVDPATAEAIRNQALYLKQLIGPDTQLPWLGQIWRCDWLAQARLIPIPFIGPAELLTTFGLFLTGLSQFWGWPRPLKHIPAPAQSVSK
jgi:hypothetical protein